MQSTAVSAILAIATATAALAGSREEQRRLTPSDIAAMAKSGTGAGTSGVAGIQTTVLSGDPTAAGPYTIALRVPAHTKIAAHTHRDDRVAVVMSGVWFFGYGSNADETEVKALEPGSFYTEPADAPHFAMTRDEPAVVPPDLVDQRLQFGRHGSEFGEV
ncbi:MAG TPA: cupin domain-containing protein, partial [Bradyrhizobium sp.]|nr:cupin domain-containing protein [Bradyrhizobium sp.]